MPFDGTDETDLSVPSLRNLAYLLRHQELWPDGFEWNYCRTSTCAVGLSWCFWPRVTTTAGDLEHCWKGGIHLPHSIYTQVRPPGVRGLLGPWAKTFVRPEHVAAAIARYLLPA